MQDRRCTVPCKGFGGCYSTRYMQRNGRQRVSVGPSCPRSPSQAAMTRPTSLSSEGQTHLSKGYGINYSRFLSLSCGSISLSPAACTFGGCERCPHSSSHRLLLLLLSSKGPSVLALPLCPEHRPSESVLSGARPLWLVGRAAGWKSRPASSAKHQLCSPAPEVPCRAQIRTNRVRVCDREELPSLRSLSPRRCSPASLNRRHSELVLPCPDVVPLGLAGVLRRGAVFPARALGIALAQVWQTPGLGG